MKLYSADFSPPCRAVMLTLEALGNVQYEKITVNVAAGEGQAPEYLKINPMGQIPALVDGDVVVTQR